MMNGVLREQVYTQCRIIIQRRIAEETFLSFSTFTSATNYAINDRLCLCLK
jgi:hypothetical protein